MIDTQPSRAIPIDSIIIKARTYEGFGDIEIAESVSTFGLLQPLVINESNELVDGQSRIKAYIQLGRTEIPTYRISLEEIILGELHVNSNRNRKDFTTSEMVAISNAVEKFLRKRSRSIRGVRSNQKSDENTIAEG